jgi:hypothetical protein
VALRAIIQRRRLDSSNGAETQQWVTIDFDAPEIETELRRGGMGENGYEFSQLFAVEIRSLEERARRREVQHEDRKLSAQEEEAYEIKQREAEAEK